MDKKNDAHPKLSLTYLLREPKLKSEKSPVIFFFHGYGSNEEDLFPLASKIPENFLVISARAPIVLGDGQYAWFPIDWSAGTPRSTIDDARVACVAMEKFIEECISVFEVDQAKVFTIGFSQGAITSTMLALTHPGIIKGVVSLSGRVFSDMQNRPLQPATLADIYFFMGHGVGDDVIPVSYAHKQKEFLETLGVQLEYHEYPIAHAISGEEYRDVLAWLAKFP